MKKKLLAVIIALLVIALSTIGYAEEGIMQRYERADGMVVEVWLKGVYYEKMNITVPAGVEGETITLTITGNPVKTDALAKCLEFFGIYDAFNRADGRLNYLNILVELGFEETNI